MAVVSHNINGIAENKLAKTSTTGTVSWQSNIDYNDFKDYRIAVEVDNSNSIYVLGSGKGAASKHCKVFN